LPFDGEPLDGLQFREKVQGSVHRSQTDSMPIRPELLVDFHRIVMALRGLQKTQNGLPLSGQPETLSVQFIA
jgi:hypothetical protein